MDLLVGVLGLQAREDVVEGLDTLEVTAHFQVALTRAGAGAGAGACASLTLVLLLMLLLAAADVARLAFTCWQGQARPVQGKG